MADPPDILVANTAIGMRAWLSEAESHGLGDQLVEALRGATVLARGRRRRAPSTPPASTSAGGPVRDARRAARPAVHRRRRRRPDRLPADGGESHEVADELRAAGADVIEVPVYRWQLPEDVRPAERLVEATIEGRVHVVTFTSGPAVGTCWRSPATWTSRATSSPPSAGPATAVTVGPVSAATARRQGIQRAMTPSRARLVPDDPRWASTWAPWW